MGWAMTVNMGYRGSAHVAEDAFPWRHGFLENAYQRLYGKIWNVTVPELFAFDKLGDNEVGDLADGGVAGGDGDGWRRAEGGGDEAARRAAAGERARVAAGRAAAAA